MAEIKTPAVTALTAEDGAVVNPNEYLANPTIIPFELDNGELGVNNADTITFSEPLPDGTTGLSITIKTAGVGNSSTLTLSAGGTNLTGALAVGGALDATYTFINLPDLSGLKIIGTVGTGDWDDGANDVYGYITLITNQ